ncbi:MAG: hypothetical protein ACI4NM_02125, partial [Bullifex sp.]
MRKAALFFIILPLTVLPLCAKVDIVWNFETEESDLKYFEKKLASRLSPLESEGETVEFLSWDAPLLTVSLFGDERKVPVSRDTADSAVNSLLFYNQHFLSDADVKLDWIYDRSFSTSSILKRGTVYEAISPSGKPVGLLVADKTGDDVTELNVIRSSSLVPGLELRKTSPWLFTASAGLVFSPSFRVSADISVRNISLIYPFRPVIRAKYAHDAVSDSAYLFSAGVGYHFPLSVLFGSRIPVLSDSMIGADCFITLGYAGTFVYGAGYEISFSWFLNSHFGLI